MALQNFDLRRPFSEWLDAVYAILADAPHDVLEPLMKHVTMETAKIAPDRETWGLLPEHQAMSKGLSSSSPPQIGQQGKPKMPSGRQN